MMIVEFCKYGNLSIYLRGKRDDFIVYKVSLLNSGSCRKSWAAHLYPLSICAGQNQDGNVGSGSDCELSELMKRRLESVASTGSSASSGFIEDKSYCDSEEEEEGKGLASLHPCTSSHSVGAPCCQPRPSQSQLCSREIKALLGLCSDGRFPPPVGQYNHCSRSHCHPTEIREASVYFLSQAPVMLFSGAAALLLHVHHVLFLVWFDVYSDGLVEGPLVSFPWRPLTSTLGPKQHISPDIWKIHTNVSHL